MPHKRGFVRKQDMPFPHQGSNGLLTCGTLPQQVARGIETARDKRLECRDPDAMVLCKREFETPGISKNDHSRRGGLVTR